MTELNKQFHIDIGREMRTDNNGNPAPHYHAQVLSVPDAKVLRHDEATLNGLMQHVSRLIRKKEKENLLFPMPEKAEPSRIIVPTGNGSWKG